MRLETSRLHRVLCAVDVERSGTTSLAMASLLGERFHASVDALYATSAMSLAPSIEPVRQLITDQDAQERLSGMVGSVTRKVRVSSYLTAGPASAVILTHSEVHTSDLIVMASSPHRRVAGQGHTIAPVSERAPCAVLTVGDRFKPAPMRRILLPVGPAGVEKHACSWVTTLASRFDAEVGLIRIASPRAGVDRAAAGRLAPSLASAGAVECGQLLAALCRAGIDAYEIAHSGGRDGDALAELGESGAFDAIVFGLSSAAEVGEGHDALVAAVRNKTSASVLSVRSIRSSMPLAPSRFDPPRRVALDVSLGAALNLH